MKPEIQRYFAELIGTFVLVFAGAGAVIANSATNGAVGVVGIALAHGIALMSMVYVFGNLSGAHINPAVTIAFLFARKIKLETAVGYILFQLAGSVLAGIALLAVFPLAPSTAYLGVPALNTSAGMTSSLGAGIEAVLTFFLVFTVFGLALDKKNSTPMVGLAVGLVLALGLIVGGPFTGAALNPARWFGPAMVSQYFSNWWVYIVGPIVGALVAAVVYLDAFMPESRMKKK